MEFRIVIGGIDLKKIKNIIFLVLVFSLFSGISYGDDLQATLVFQGKKVDTQVIIRDSKSYIPMEDLGEMLSFDYELIASRGIKLNCKDGSRSLELESQVIRLNGQDYGSIRDISQALEEDLKWDGKNKVIILGSPLKEVDLGDSFLYYNRVFDYTISLPNSWKETAVIKEEEGVLLVYDKKTYDRSQDEGKNFGPIFTLESNLYPNSLEFPYEDNIILDYDGENYIEGVFNYDFPFFKDTVDSYKLVKGQAVDSLYTFTKIGDDSTLVRDNKNNYKEEVGVLEDILANYLPSGLFNIEDTIAYRLPAKDSTMLYLRKLDDKSYVSVKLEAEFDSKSKLTRYHLKDYGQNIPDKKITEGQAKALANEFIKKYQANVDLINIPNLYPSLYEKGLYENYGDLGGNYGLVVNLNSGLVEMFFKLKN